jgi:hypothetical protein
VEQRPLHWSEKAKLSQQSGVSSAGSMPPQPRPGAPQSEAAPQAAPSPESGHKPPKRRGPSKGFWLIASVVLVLAAAAAAVWFWYLPSRGAGADASSTTVAAVAPTSTTVASPVAMTTTSVASGLPAPELTKSYKSPSLGCAFKYPGSWIKYAPEIALSATNDDPTMFIVGNQSSEAPAGIPNDFVVFTGARSPGQPAPSARTQVDEMVADFLTGNYASTRLYESAHDFQVNGMSACSWAVRSEGSLGAGINTTVVVSTGDGLYFFSFWSVETRLPQNQAIFEAILNSFVPPASQ